MRKRTKIAASAGAALAIAGGGAAVAADRLTPKAESQAVLDDAAKQLGVTPAKLTGALKQALKNRIDDLVQNGVLTKAQADELKQRIDSTEVPLLTSPFFARPNGFGVGPGRGFGPDLLFRHVKVDFGAAATYLGLDEAELQAALREGKSLADVAKDQNKTVDGLVAAIVASEQKQLDQAVKDGRVTDAQRDQIEANLEERVTQIVNADVPRLGFHFGPGAFLPSRGSHLDAAATYLGVEEAQLRAALREGKSLADVAKAEGKSVKGLVDALVADEKKQLDQAVKDGRLTDAQRDQIQATLEKRVTGFVNGERAAFGFGHVRPGLFPGNGPGAFPFPEPQRQDSGDA
jgi:hypothetical protein